MGRFSGCLKRSVAVVLATSSTIAADRCDGFDRGLHNADSLARAIPFERRFPDPPDPKVRAPLATLSSTGVLYPGGSSPP